MATPKTVQVLAPTGELGAPGTAANIEGWIDQWELTPELRWPNAVHIFDQMRKDAHIAGCLRAITLPIRRTTWDLDPDSLTDCRPEVIDLVRQDLGVIEAGTRIRRPKGAIKFNDVLRHALLQLPFGFSIMEKVYEIDDNGQARLRKLAPRMQRTIWGWQTDRVGALTEIRQLVPRPDGYWDRVLIPIERLCVFIHEQEGSDPTGNSLIRPAYGHWMFKQALMKVDALAAERNGMGIPVFEYQTDQISKKEALDVASNVRAGEKSGLAIPAGAGKLELVGVTGQLRDIVSSIKYHDQEMGRLMLAMFLDLGQARGAMALGQTFVDFFVMALQSFADDIAETITEDVIRQLVEYNYGPDEPYPTLSCDEITGDTDLTADAIKALADAKVLVPDAGLEEYFRKRYGWPQADTSTARKPDPVVPAPVLPPVVEHPGTPGTPGDGQPGFTTLARLEAKFAELTAGPRAVGARVPSPS